MVLSCVTFTNRSSHHWFLKICQANHLALREKRGYRPVPPHFWIRPSEVLVCHCQVITHEISASATGPRCSTPSHIPADKANKDLNGHPGGETFESLEPRPRLRVIDAPSANCRAPGSSVQLRSEVSSLQLARHTGVSWRGIIINTASSCQSGNGPFLPISDCRGGQQ